MHMHQRFVPSLPFFLRVGLFELLFLTPLIFYGWATTFSMTKETFAEITSIGLFLFWIFILNKEKSYPFLKSSFFLIPIILFAFVLLLSTIWSNSLYASFLRLGVWGCFLLAYFLSLWVTEEEKWLSLLPMALLISGFLAAGYGILQFYEIELPIWKKVAGRMRLFSTFGNPNYLAGYLAASLHLGLLFFFTKKRWKFLWLVIIATLYTSLLLTHTRGAWAAFLLSSIFVLILILIYKGKKFFRTNKTPIFTLTAIILIITVIFSFPNPLNLKKAAVIERGVSAVEFRNSASQRILIWKVAFELIKEKPFLGWGIGTFGIHYPLAQGALLSRKENKEFIPKANRSIYAHNDYLQIWVETGILGLSLFLWIIVSFYKKTLSILKNNSSDEEYLNLY